MRNENKRNRNILKSNLFCFQPISIYFLVLYFLCLSFIHLFVFNPLLFSIAFQFSVRVNLLRFMMNLFFRVSTGCGAIYFTGLFTQQYGLFSGWPWLRLLPLPAACLICLCGYQYLFFLVIH